MPDTRLHLYKPARSGEFPASRPSAALLPMHRRELIRLAGVTAGGLVLASLAPEELHALGRALHLAREPGAALSADQLALVRAAADRILPETTSPGAAAANVDQFVDRLAARWFSDTERQRLVDGLDALDQRALRSDGRRFVALTSDRQDAILSTLELEAERTGGPSETFWHQFKWCTLYGYYTSRVGIDEELRTIRIPGRFEGSVPVEG